MPESHRRYTFPPLERRGLVLGLQTGQVAILVAGVTAALLVSQVAPAPEGIGLALLLLVGVAAAALCPRAGRPVVYWLPGAIAWVRRRRRGSALTPQPVAGKTVVASATATTTGTRIRPSRDTAPVGLDLLEVAGWPGHDTIGLVRDHRCGTLAAVVPVHGRSFVLLDVEEQVGQLEAWRSVLGILARAGTPLRRIQWLHCSAAVSGSGLEGTRVRMPRGRPGHLPEEGAAGHQGPACPGIELARDSYRQLVGDVGLTTQAHNAWMVLAVGGSYRPGFQAQRSLDELRRELRLLEGQLRNADLQVGPPLRLDGLRGLVAAAHGRDRTEAGGRRGGPWPMASDEAWSALRADGTWHATFWVSEWPRVEVNPDFLTPLLLCDGRRTVSVVMAPVPPERAAREVRAARAADVADEELRNRAGFLPNARRRREAEGVIRRESELADGHADYRFSGYVTVTAGDRDGLEAACVETEQAAHRAHLELRRLYGRQAEAFTWTLPLARGLA